MSTDTETAVPTLADIEREARRLIAEHVPSVDFQWDRAVRRAGACKFRRPSYGAPYAPYVITLSRPIFSHSEEARRGALDVILHEIAHALAGAKAGHGYEWRRIALGLGCTSDRCHTLPVPPSGIIRWCSGGCPHDGTETSRTRMPKQGARYRCNACREEVTFERAGEVAAA